jgi:parallel beta-helix repeat protein
MAGAAGGSADLTSFGDFSPQQSVAINNISFENCKFRNLDSAFHPLQCNNFRIKDCQVFQRNTLFSAAQFGSPFFPGVAIKELLVLNSTFLIQDSQSGANLIILLTGDGAKFQNVIFESDTDSNSPSAIIIGAETLIGPGFTFPGIIFDNVIVKGPNDNAIYVSGGRNFTLKNSQVNEARIAILLDGTTNTTIKENEIQGPALNGSSPSTGISIVNTTSSDVEENVIRRFDIGVSIDATSVGNVVVNNKIIDNGTAIIDNGTNLTMPNILFANPPPAVAMASASTVNEIWKDKDF